MNTQLPTMAQLQRMPLRELKAHYEQNPDDEWAWELLCDHHADSQYECEEA